MNTEKKKIYVEKEVTRYVAFDGKEFEQMRDCENYESDLIDKRIAESTDIAENEEAKGCMPFGGREYSENHEFRWLKPLNEKGVKLLNELFCSRLFHQFDNKDIGEWICLEISDDDVYLSSLSANLEYSEAMKKKFGIGNDVTGGSEYEYILNFANSGTFDYEDGAELKTLRVLWTAYCLHKNYDVDTASYDSVLREIFDRLGDVTPEFMKKGFDKFDRYMCKYLV